MKVKRKYYRVDVYCDGWLCNAFDFMLAESKRAARQKAIADILQQNKITGRLYKKLPKCYKIDVELATVQMVELK